MPSVPVTIFTASNRGLYILKFMLLLEILVLGHEFVKFSTPKNLSKMWSFAEKNVENAKKKIVENLKLIASGN